MAALRPRGNDVWPLLVLKHTLAWKRFTSKRNSPFGQDSGEWQALVDTSEMMREDGRRQEVDSCSAEMQP